MEALTRHRGILPVPTRYYSQQVRRMDFRHRDIKMRHLIQQQQALGGLNVHTLKLKYTCIKLGEENCKRLLLDEFIDECKINKEKYPKHCYEKMYIARSNIQALIEHNLILSLGTVVNGLISQLEPFPFDHSKLQEKKGSLTLQCIRNEIEKEYLAWRYQTSIEEIERILHRYKSCLYEFRSVGNMEKNINLLDSLHMTKNLSIPEKIYHINQKPFIVESVLNFQENVAGLDWQILAKFSPAIYRHSHQYINFVVSVLRELNFTQTQIQRGLPFLHLTFEHFIKRLTHMLTHEKLVKHRDKENFLELLQYQSAVLLNLVDSCNASFAELALLEGRRQLLNVNSALYHVHQFFAVPEEAAVQLKKHSKYKFVSEKQIKETLTFLKEKNFKDEEVAESITVVLYPRNLIESTLAKIKSDGENLKKYGFDDGCIAEGTNYFKCGTKQRQKILQLCLYYLERPYHFSGDGIWGYRAEEVEEWVDEEVEPFEE